MSKILKIKEILPKVLNRYNLSKTALASWVCLIWDKEIKIEDTKPLFFKNNTLFISVKNSSQASDIKLKEKEILKKINQKLKKDLVKKIVTRIDSDTNFANSH